MGLNKVVQNASNKLSRAVPVANKLVSGAGNVLGKAGNIADKVSTVSGKILSNPIVEGIVAANPELAPAYGLAVTASKLTGQAGQMADKGSAVAGKVSNVLEKVQSATQPKPTMQFA